MILNSSRVESSVLPTVDIQPSLDTIRLEMLPLFPAETPLSVEVMASIFSVGQRALGRMVQRGELPPAIKVGGKNLWMAGVLRDHLQRRAEEAAKLAEERRALKQRVMPHRKR
ncbi:MAG: hypothetical protein L6Q38_13170 [Nitrospira sp.]|nr:hypothetical protein [Nitrospira sp.]